MPTQVGALGALPEDATKYYDGTGEWSVPPGTGGGGAPADAQYLVAAAHAGLSQEVVVTSAGLALLDDADAAAQRTTLGLGTLATQSGTFSGTSSGTNTGDQTISDATISTSDITTNNATSAKHGFLPKLSNVATQFLNGLGAWAVPAGGGDPSAAWPVGSIFLSTVSTNPATLLGFGTWVEIGAGRVLVGLDAGQTEFDTLGETGGAKTVTLTEAEIPSHTHGITDPGHTHLTQRYPTATGGSSGFTIDTSMSGTLADNTLPVKSATTGVTANNTGGGGAHTNLQPYLVVMMWSRTA